MAGRTNLAGRLQALRKATDLARGRVPDEVVEAADAVVRRATGRLAISGDATVVALAGATGSGKSTTFNALAGGELSLPGVRRPTTSHAAAAVFGDEGADDLLDWLEVKARHRVPAAGVADPGEPARDELTRAEPGGVERGGVERGGGEPRGDEPRRAAGGRGKQLVPAREGKRRFGSSGGESLDGLVLLDLPDHDSTELSHRLEVDRLVELVDVLVWVVDPQKYADAALHEQYLRPLARHSETMLVLLNQVDKLSARDRTAATGDLRGLLDEEGLDKVPVMSVSAATGEGMPEFRRHLAAVVASKKAATSRVRQDVVAAGEQLRDACADVGRTRDKGGRDAGGLGKATVGRLNAAMEVAAGVPVVTEAVGQAWRRRGGLATGWPVLAWLAKFRPDPLQRLHLDRFRSGRKAPKEIDPARVGRSSLPATTSVERARVDTAIRDLVDEVAGDLPRGWSDAVRTAAAARRDAVPDRLDRAVATTDLDLQRHRRWWQVVRVLQWVLVAAVVAGLGWLAVDLVLLYLQLPPLPDVRWQQVPVPTLLVVGGVIGGLVVAAASRIGVEVGARRRAARARKQLGLAIAEVTDELVIEPVRAELARHDEVRQLAVTAAE
ncbi:ABC transporter [Microlunatus sp. Y2014]|uniref:ABC transporter n=1 Tax=Microlunatus sp. Y2014 TaxID=3418488 RepID=UPI003DA70A21